MPLSRSIKFTVFAIMESLIMRLAIIAFNGKQRMAVTSKKIFLWLDPVVSYKNETHQINVPISKSLYFCRNGN